MKQIDLNPSQVSPAKGQEQSVPADNAATPQVERRTADQNESAATTDDHDLAAAEESGALLDAALTDVRDSRRHSAMVAAKGSRLAAQRRDSQSVGMDVCEPVDEHPDDAAEDDKVGREVPLACEVIGQEAAPAEDGDAAAGSVGGAGGMEEMGAGIGNFLMGDPEDSRPSPVIRGISDRAHYLAMAAISVLPGLRPAAKKRASTLPALKPATRSECERRCGADGFCDPSSPLGCGGEHCGYLNERL